MIDHMTLTVRDLKASVAFYSAALKPLGYGVKMDVGVAVGLGDHKPSFWLRGGPIPTQPMHIAFKAANRALVDAFHDAALKAGAKDDGKPGIREIYHPSYYGAFVIDPDGHPIEAVCHASAEAAGPGGKLAEKGKRMVDVLNKAAGAVGGLAGKVTGALGGQVAGLPAGKGKGGGMPPGKGKGTEKSGGKGGKGKGAEKSAGKGKGKSEGKGKGRAVGKGKGKD